MAKRRGIGNRLSNLADIFLRSHLQQQQTAYNDELQRGRLGIENQYISGRQKESSDLQAQIAMLQKIMSPDGGQRVAAAFAKGNPGQKVAGMDPSLFINTPQENINDLTVKYGGAKDLTGLPTEPVAHAAYHAMPGSPEHTDTEDRVPIQELMKAVAGQRQNLQSATPPIAQAGVMNLPGGDAAKTTNMVNPWEAMNKPVQTDFSGQQEGNRAGIKSLRELQTPGLTQEKVTAANLFSQGTQAQNAAYKGAEAGAVERARLAAEWDPNIVAKKLDFESKKQAAALLKQNRSEDAKLNLEYSRSIIASIPRADKLYADAEQLLTAGGYNPSRAFNAIKAATGADTPLHMMNLSAASLAQSWANAIGGNKGQTSENDRNAMYVFFPSASDSAETVAAKKENYHLMTKVLPQILGQLNPDASPADRINLALKMFDAAKAAEEAQAGAK